MLLSGLKVVLWQLLCSTSGNFLLSPTKSKEDFCDLNNKLLSVIKFETQSNTTAL